MLLLHLVLRNAFELALKRLYFVAKRLRYFEVGARLALKVVLALFFAEVFAKVDGASLNLLDLVGVEPFNALALFPQTRFLRGVRN